MCGIIVGRKGDLEQSGGMKKHLTTIQHRGTDSYGYIAYIKDADKWETYKTLTLKKLTKEITRLKPNDYIICHNRAKSIGAKTIGLAHPITTNGVAVIHNGTNRDVYQAIRGAGSDTEAISMLQANANDFDVPYKWFGDVGVVFTVDLEDTKYFHLHRDKIRPLVIHKDTGIMASEPLFDGEWANIKEQNTYSTLHKTPLEYTNYTDSEFIEVSVARHLHCECCKKDHIHEKSTDKECLICKIRGLKCKPLSSHKGKRGNSYNHGYSLHDDDYDDILELVDERASISRHTTIDPIVNKHMQIVSGFVAVKDNNWVELQEFLSLDLDEQYNLLNINSDGELTPSWKKENYDLESIRIQKGANLYVFNNTTHTLDSKKVYGFVVRGKDGNWYLVEDDENTVEESTWYICNYVVAKEDKEIAIEPYVYASDCFAEYLVEKKDLLDKSLIIDMTDTYDVDVDMLKYWSTSESELINRLIQNTNGEWIFPIDFKV